MRRSVATIVSSLALVVGCAQPSSRPAVTEGPDPSIEQIATALDAYLEAYELGVAETQAGVLTGDYVGPTAEQWEIAKARSIAAVGERYDLVVRRTVDDTIDAMTGFDFRHAPVTTARSIGVRRDSGLREWGDFRGLGLLGGSHPLGEPGRVTIAAIHTARMAFGAAFSGNDPKLVSGPLGEFWIEYPDYAPQHTGRCWDHGHEYLDQDLTSSFDCQVTFLERYSGGLLYRFADPVLWKAVREPEIAQADPVPQRLRVTPPPGSAPLPMESIGSETSAAGCNCYYGYTESCGGIWQIWRTCGGYGGCSGSGSSDGTCMYTWQDM